MKVCVLLPDYSTSKVDYQYYDPPRKLQNFLPNNYVVETIFLNKLTAYKQLLLSKYKNYDIYVNLCEGYLDWEVPSIDVIYSLDVLNLPYTGPTLQLYDPKKTLMKYVSYCAGVAFPNYIEVSSETEMDTFNFPFNYPMFIKPAKAGDSLGIDDNALVNNYQELILQAKKILEDYPSVLIEEYIQGREFTVLVAANADGKTCQAFSPIEYIFPKNFAYKTYALKTSELHPNANVVVKDETLANQLKEKAMAIFTAFNGKGYARLDFRMNAKNEIYFLEINFTCSVFYEDEYQGSADYILNNSAMGKQGFLLHIIREGIARHREKQKCFTVKGNAINGFGIYANKKIVAGDIIFKGEEKAQRLATLPFIQEHYNHKQLQDFKQYAYPVSNAVYILWDEDANEWAPQNHSCNPNTQYVGLNVVAIKDIETNEELTIDYANILNEHAESFTCQCGQTNCRKLIKGIEGNSVELRLRVHKL
jgi:D-alanine-D-alanine ligase